MNGSYRNLARRGGVLAHENIFYRRVYCTRGNSTTAVDCPNSGTFEREANRNLLSFHYLKVLARSILLGPEEGPDKYLYMAQLHEGREALGHYEKGLELLQKQLAGGAAETKEAEAALRQRVCMAYCSVGELFLTDLCFDQDAETRCQVCMPLAKGCPFRCVRSLQRMSTGRSVDSSQYSASSGKMTCRGTNCTLFPDTPLQSPRLPLAGQSIDGLD